MFFIVVYVLFLCPPSERSETGGHLNGRNAEKCIQFMSEKLVIFPYGQYIVGNVVLLAF